MKKLILTQLLFFLLVGLFAQSPVKENRNKWYFFDNNRIRNSTLLVKEKLALCESDELIEISRKGIPSQIHIDYIQKKEGVEVWGSKFITHSKNGFIHSANGNIIQNLSIGTSPSITKNRARNLALDKINATCYAWHSDDFEEILKDIKKNKNSTFFPEGELYIYSPDFNAGTARLVYVFDVFSLEPMGRVNIFIDAHTGEVIKEIELIEHVEVEGTGMTRYNGMQTITLDAVNNTYYLNVDSVDISSGSPCGIETRNGNPLPFPPFPFSPQSHPLDYLPSPTGIPFQYHDVNWGYEDPAAINVHWATEKTLEYIRSINSDFLLNVSWELDKILSVVHYGNNMNNAFYNGTFFLYGDGADGVSPWVSLDIVAHEIAHAIIQSTANLIPEGESGALNESFADILAVMVERYILGESDDIWRIGEDFTNGVGIRNFDNNMIYDDPATGYYLGLEDHGGVHDNCDVQNRWFYMLSQEISIEKASRICFYSLTNYLTPYSDYKDARIASIHAAEYLYPSSGINEIVCSMWDSVGVVGACPVNQSITINTANLPTAIYANNDISISIASMDIDSVDIFFSKDSSSWEMIESLVPYSRYSSEPITWTVPDIFGAGDNLYLKVVSSANASVSDIVFYGTTQDCGATVELDDDSTICIGETVDVSDYLLAYDNANNFTWTIIGPNDRIDTIEINDINSGIVPLYTYDTVGVYEVISTVYTSDGCYDTSSKQVFVADTSVHFTVEETDYRSANFHIQDFNPLVEYSIVFGDGHTLTNIQSSEIFHQYDENDAVTLYAVQLAMVSSCGSFTQEQFVVFPDTLENERESCNEEWKIVDYANYSVLYYHGNIQHGGSQGDSLSTIVKGPENDYVITTVEASSKHINAIIVEDGTIHEGSHNSLTIINEEETIRALESLSISVLESYGNDTLIIGTDNNKVILYNLSTSNPPLTIVDTTEIMVPAKVNAIVLHEDTAYIGTPLGLYHIDLTAQNITAEPINSDLKITALAIAGDSLYLGTGNGNGLFKLSLSNLMDSPSDISVGYSTINEIFTDRDGFIWIGAPMGMARYDPITGNHRAISLPDGSSENQVKAINQDSSGNIWVGTTEWLGVYHVPNLTFFHKEIHCSRDTSTFENRSHSPTYTKFYIEKNNEIIFENSDTNHLSISYPFGESGEYVITLLSKNDNCEMGIKRNTIHIPPSHDEIKESIPDTIGICGASSTIIELNEDVFSVYTWKDTLGDTIGNSTSCEVDTNHAFVVVEIVTDCNVTITDTITIKRGDHCVWPGDTNEDGIVNHVDLLFWGLLQGEISPERDHQGSLFQPHIINFSEKFGSDYDSLYTVDLANADCNGDGIIDDEDREIIEMNIGKFKSDFSYTPIIADVNASYILVPELMGVNPVTNELMISVSLKDKDNMDVVFYGLAFILEYDIPSLVVDGNPNPINIEALLASPDSRYMHIQNPPLGMLSRLQASAISYTGTNQLNRTLGTDNYMSFSFAIGEEALLPGGEKGRYATISPHDILMVNNYGDTIRIKGEALDIYLPDSTYQFAVTTSSISCNKQQITVQHLSEVDSNLVYEYEWKRLGTDTDEIISENAQTIEVDEAGDYSIVVKAESGTGTIDTIWQDMITLDSIDKDFEVHITQDAGGALTASIHPNSNSVELDNFNYLWSTGEIDSLIIPETSGYYSVIAFRGDGCTATYEMKNRIFVDSNENVKEGDFSNIYPSTITPFNNTLNVDYHTESTGPLRISILDINGRVVMTEERHAIKGKNQFGIGIRRDLPEGIYFISFRKRNRLKAHRFMLMKP